MASAFPLLYCRRSSLINISPGLGVPKQGNSFNMLFLLTIKLLYYIYHWWVVGGGGVGGGRSWSWLVVGGSGRGRPLETTGDHRGHFPRTDFGPAAGI